MLTNDPYFDKSREDMAEMILERDEEIDGLYGEINDLKRDQNEIAELQGHLNDALETVETLQTQVEGMQVRIDDLAPGIFDGPRHPLDMD